MMTGDRLTVIGIGVGVIIAITNGTCSTNQRFTDMQRTMETGFAEAAEQRRIGFAEAAQQRDQIIRRLERLEDLHLKPTAGQ